MAVGDTRTETLNCSCCETCDCFDNLGAVPLFLTVLATDCVGLTGLTLGLSYNDGTGTECLRPFWVGSLTDELNCDDWGSPMEATGDCVCNWAVSAFLRCGCLEPVDETEIVFAFTISGIVIGEDCETVCGTAGAGIEWGVLLTNLVVDSFNCDPFELVLTGTLSEFFPGFCTPCEGDTITFVITE